jgi:hypothetical protein
MKPIFLFYPSLTINAVCSRYDAPVQIDTMSSMCGEPREGGRAVYLLSEK